MVSPFEIDLLLHCHTSPTKYTGIGNQEMIDETLEKFQAWGLIDRADFPKTTAMGEKLVKMWCETPLPVNVWIDPREAAKENEK